jgi:AraC-like DNA-binding protein
MAKETDPALPGRIMQNLSLRVLEQRHIRLDTRWNFPGTTSPFNRLYIVTAGTGTVSFRHATLTLEKNRAYLLPLHTTFDLKCTHFLEKYYAHFRLELYGRDVFENITTWRETALAPALVKRIAALAHSGQVGDCLTLRSIILDILGRWASVSVTDMAVAHRQAEEYGPLFRYIDSHCRAGLTMPQLAGVLGLTPNILSKRFRRDMGISVKKFYTRRLVQRAQEELVLTGKRINEIAAGLQFSDEFYFSNFFRKMTGLAPRAYRQQNRM